MSTIATIPDLRNYAGTLNETINLLGYYTPNDGGGGFYYWDNNSIQPDDGGAVIKATSVTTGRWIGIFENDLINAKRFGAKADNTQDDLPNLVVLTAYCIQNRKNILLPEGVYRITDTWYIGGPVASVEDLYNGSDIPSLPSFNLTNHINSRLWTPIKIIGTGKSHIHGDFSATELKAIVYYNLQGGNSNGKTGDLYTGEFTDIGIYCQGSWTGTNTYVGRTSTNPLNNQVGLAAINTLQLKIQSITLIGLKLGMLHNNCYFSYTNKIYFEYCVEGFTNLTSAGSLLENFIAYYCDLGYNIRGGQIHMSSINIEHCSKGLWIKTSNIVINGSYLEQISGTPQEALIIGISTTDPNWTSTSRSDRIIINALTIAGGSGASIVMKDTARRLYINSGNVNGAQGIKTENAENRIFAYSCAGVSTANITSGPGKILQRNELFEAETISSSTANISASLNVTGVSNLNTIQATSKASLFGGITSREPTIHENFIQGGSVEHSITSFFFRSIGALDRIIIIGKFPDIDNTRLNGRINVIASSYNSFNNPSSIIDISYMNEAVNRFAFSFNIFGSLDSNSYSMVTFDYDGNSYAGIRIISSATARIPTRFYFTGVIKSNPYTLTTIETSAATNIQLLEPNSFTAFDIHAHRLIVPKGKIGIGIQSAIPSAKLEIGPGTSGAGGGQLKLSAGTLVTTPEDGLIEYNGTSLFFSKSNKRTRIQTTEILTLASASTVTWDFERGNKATITLQTNVTLQISNIIAGAEVTLLVKQDSSGNRTLSLPANSKVANNGNGQAAISTAPNSISMLRSLFDGSSYYWSVETNFT